MTMLTAEAQIRYLIQWFHEWSELQRSDFLPIMAEKYSNKAYVNGIVNSISNVNCRDKPMSLFECRVNICNWFFYRQIINTFHAQVKLFKEWFAQWNTEHKENFLKQISEIDASFGEKLNAELENGIVHESNNVNGEALLED